MSNQSYEENSKVQNVYIGLDVHLKQWHVCIIQGDIVRKPFMQAPTAAALLSHLQRNYPDMKYYSAYEAGMSGLSIHYALEEAGITNIVFNPADIAQSNKERKRKTDAIDARKIARELAAGTLNCIHLVPKTRWADRTILRQRQSIVHDLTRQKIRLRHLLHSNGIEIPQEYSKGKWPMAFLEWIKNTAKSSCPESLATTMQMKVKAMEGLGDQLKEVNKQLKALMDSKDYSESYQLLMSVPGVGNITATTLLLECGDLTAFSSADKFCAYIGLIPDMDQSDDHEGKCGMTRRRHNTLRYMLTECAWRAISEDEVLSLLYAKYCKSMPKTKAIIKIAHKLAKIIKFVLRNKTKYAPKQG